MATKVCRTCNMRKDIADYHLSRHKTPESQCKKCKHEYTRKRRAEPEVNAAHRERTRASYSRTQSRYWRMKSVYGLERDDFDKMWEEQNGACAACKKPLDSSQKFPFAIDHNHETGAVRGILCVPCNAALGLLYENESVILGLLEYLRAVS